MNLVYSNRPDIDGLDKSIHHFKKFTTELLLYEFGRWMEVIYQHHLRKQCTGIGAYTYVRTHCISSKVWEPSRYSRMFMERKSMRRRREKDVASDEVVPIYFTISRNRMIHTRSLFFFFSFLCTQFSFYEWTNGSNADEHLLPWRLMMHELSAWAVLSSQPWCVIYGEPVKMLYCNFFSMLGMNECDRVCWCRWDETQQRDTKQVYARFHS